MGLIAMSLGSVQSLTGESPTLGVVAYEGIQQCLPSEPLLRELKMLLYAPACDDIYVKRLCSSSLPLRNASGQALSASILQPQALSAIDPQAISAIEAGMT